MQPRIVDKERILLLGVSFFGDPFAESGGWTEENEIGRLWDRFFAHAEDTLAMSTVPGNGPPVLEVHVEGHDAAARGHREVFVGVEIDELDEVPIDMLVKVLPAATYAVFTLRGEQIRSDWSQMIAEWMVGEGYQYAHPYGFQLYDSRFVGLDQLASSEIDVYIPVIRQEHASDVAAGGRS